MAFDVTEKRYLALSAALDKVEEEDGNVGLVAIADPGGLYITETCGTTEAGMELIGGILTWFISQLVEDHGKELAQSYLDNAFKKAGQLL